MSLGGLLSAAAEAQQNAENAHGPVTTAAICLLVIIIGSLDAICASYCLHNLAGSYLHSGWSHLIAVFTLLRVRRHCFVVLRVSHRCLDAGRSPTALLLLLEEGLFNYELALFVFLTFIVSLDLKILEFEQTYVCPANFGRALLAFDVPDRVKPGHHLLILLGSKIHVYNALESKLVSLLFE